MLDGVKLAFGDISLDTFRRLADQLQTQTQTALSAERRSQSQELRVERAELDARLRTVVEQLERMRALVLELERDREGKLKGLETELRQAGERATRLTDATRRLADTLGNSRSRGQWGERLAEDVLRQSGMVEHVSYRRQVMTSGGGRPDFTFIMPGGDLLHMDVKFPFENYQRSLGTDDPEQRARFETAFIRDVRTQLGEVTNRGYIAPEAGTLDVAILFIPNEEIFGAVGRLAPDLLDEALRRNIVMASPLTLLAVLAVLRRGAATYRLGREARQLAAALTEFRRSWDAWTTESDLVGRRLEEAASSFRALVGGRRTRLEQSMLRLAAIVDLEAPTSEP